MKYECCYAIKVILPYGYNILEHLVSISKPVTMHIKTIKRSSIEEKGKESGIY
jgi:hypothetical protein